MDPPQDITLREVRDSLDRLWHKVNESRQTILAQIDMNRRAKISPRARAWLYGILGLASLGVTLILGIVGIVAISDTATQDNILECAKSRDITICHEAIDPAPKHER